MARGQVLALAALLVAVLPAAAAAEEPAKLRLVAGPVSPDGHARAALLIDLAPGWKTYWRDPGEAGLPPAIDRSTSFNVETLTQHFPVPHRADDGFAVSNVYSEPMAIAFDIDARSPDAPLNLTLGVSIGVCREVCIPLTARLKAEPVSSDDPLLARAFAALPAAATPEHGLESATLAADGKRLDVTVRAPSGPAPDLFVAGPDGWSFGSPTEVRAIEGGFAFALPVNNRPRGKPVDGLAIEAVLTGAGTPVAASGFPVRTGR